jgi:hypothetical protein
LSLISSLAAEAAAARNIGSIRRIARCILDLILRSREAASRRMNGKIVASWFETALPRLLTMRDMPKQAETAAVER